MKLASLVSLGLHGAALALHRKADPDAVASQQGSEALWLVPGYPRDTPPESIPPLDNPQFDPYRDPLVEPDELPDDMDELPDDPAPAEPPEGEPIEYYDVDYWRSVTPVFSPDDEMALLNGTKPFRNLCINGWHVPELLIIGAIKAATTTLCTELEYSPSMLFPRSRSQESRDGYPARWKEGHYFDYFQKRGVTFMMGDYMKCDKEYRRVAVDGSARYAADPYVPALIKKWYGPYYRRVNFVLVVREPLKRMQSHYYHGVTKHWCMDFHQMSFRMMVTKLMMNKYYEKRWRGSTANRAFGAGCGDFIEASIYTTQIYRYFRYFDSSQFTIIPFQYVVNPVPDMHPAAVIFKRMGVRSMVPPELHENDRSHPSLKEDLSPFQRLWMSAFFYKRTSPLRIAMLLVNSKATLFAYKRVEPFKKKTVQDIAKWLQYNW